MLRIRWCFFYIMPHIVKIWEFSLIIFFCKLHTSNEFAKLSNYHLRIEQKIFLTESFSNLFFRYVASKWFWHVSNLTTIASEQDKSKSLVNAVFAKQIFAYNVISLNESTKTNVKTIIHINTHTFLFLFIFFCRNTHYLSVKVSKDFDMWFP